MNEAVESFHEYILNDILGHIEGITSKKMFGGYSFYLEGKIFGLITGEAELYFKVDETNRAQYESRGSHPFIYDGWKDKTRKPITMPYWLVPEEIMEDRELVEEWIQQSATISGKSKK